ncbi:ABC transporter permease [Radicibacter daui]|uniref:ABC transporter permease n=1 Tax=Radicibacter daui TaxID=3064829 RepID=UPI004046FB4A
MTDHTLDTLAGSPGTLPDRLDLGWRRWMRWEVLLLAVAIGIFLINSFASPYFLDPWNLSDATFNFTEKAIIALAMALLIIAGDIDLSVASIIALASVTMGAAAEAGVGTPGLVAVGLLTGLAAGAFNGFLITRFQLPSIVVTIGTMSLFRGICYIALGDGVYRNYPSSFAWFGQGYVWWVFSFELALFAVLAFLFGLLLHKTVFGRQIFAVGNNPVAALFSGVRVQKVRFSLFLLTGLASGIASILLTARVGSTRPSIALGWELEVVTMVVLGGVSIMGGSGTIVGVVIAAFVMGLVTFGFGLLNVPGIVMSIFVGLLLIGVIALPIGIRKLARRWQGVSGRAKR